MREAYKADLIIYRMKLDNYLEIFLEKNLQKNKICLDNLGSLIKPKLAKFSVKEISSNLNVSERLIYYWFKNQRPIPIDKLVELEEKFEMSVLEEAYNKSKFMSINGVPNKTKICRELTLELCYLVGYIYGDGHLGKNYDFLLTDFSEDNILVSRCLIKKIFGMDFKWGYRKDRNYFFIDSSWKIGQILLNKLFEMPLGKKNNKLSLPRLINNAGKKERFSFCLGLLAADYGGNSFTQTSFNLIKSINKILTENNLKSKLFGPYGPYSGNEVPKYVLFIPKETQKIINLIHRKIIDNFKNARFSQILDAPVV